MAKVGDDTYTSLNDAFNHYYSAAPTTIVLTRDVALSEAITVSGDITLDIGEHNITVSKAIWPTNDTAEADKRFAIFTVPTDSKLTIQGSGKITAMKNDSYVIAVLGGECVLNDTVEYTGNIEVVEVNTGKLTVNGGTFNLEEKNTTVGNPGEGGDCRFMLNKKDTARDTSTIEVKGGTFCGFDPGNNLAEGENTNFLAEGYESKLTSGTAGTINAVYTVSQKTEPAGATVTIAKYEGNDNFWGKTASDMGEITSVEKAEDGTYKVTGSANYITGWEAFNQSNPNQQKGHYMPLNIVVEDKSEELGKVTIQGETTKEVQLTAEDKNVQLVMYLDDLTDSKFTVKYGDAVYTVDVSGVTLMPKTDEKTTVEPTKDEAGNVTGIVAKPTTSDGEEETGTAVSIPNVKGLSDAKITISEVGEEEKITLPEDAEDVPEGFGDILQTGTTVKVEVMSKDSSNMLGSGNKLVTNKSITVTIGGLTTGETYYVFCITDDAVIFCGFKKLSAGTSISIKTNHLSYWTAIKETEANKSTLATAATNLAGGDAPEVDGGQTDIPTSSKLNASYKEDGLFGAQIEITGLDINKYYVCQMSKIVKGVKSSVAVKLHGKSAETLDVLPGTYEVKLWDADKEGTTLKDYSTKAVYTKNLNEGWTA